MTSVPMYVHPKNWVERELYRNRLMALPTYYVGQRVIEDGADAVESYIKATVETTMADVALTRIRALLWDHTRGRAIQTCGGGPGSPDYIELHMGKYDGPLVGFDKYRWVINIGWDEVSHEESSDYFIRLTFGAHIMDEAGNEEHLWSYWTHDFGTNPTLNDVIGVCEAVGQYVNTIGIPPVESTYNI